MTAEKYWVGFSKIPGIGRVRLGRILDHFGNLEEAWKSTEADLEATGLDDKSIQSILMHRPQIDLLAEMEKLEKSGVSIITSKSVEYPSRLKEIYDFPPLLYIRGTILPEDEWSISVVGTRRATSYGREAARKLSSELARSGITVISGLARGIDSIAHRAALDAGGRTIAVCGCGLDIIYPAENKTLAEEIMQNGALVSEHPLGIKPKPEHFPRRNRIMSGLSLGVLVIESMKKGGSLITANMALQQNREVFAVPGSIFSPESRGTNDLIRAGAKAVTAINDILEELNLSVSPKQLELAPVNTPSPQNDFEAAIFTGLNKGPLHIDELCRASALPAATVSSTLTIMELKGMVKHLGNLNYSLSQGAGRN